MYLFKIWLRGSIIVNVVENELPKFLQINNSSHGGKVLADSKKLNTNSQLKCVQHK